MPCNSDRFPYSPLVIDAMGGSDSKAKPSRNWLRKPRTPWPKRKSLSELTTEYGTEKSDEQKNEQPVQDSLF